MEQKGAYPHPQPPPAYGFDQQQQHNQYPMHPYVAPVVVEHQQQGKCDWSLVNESGLPFVLAQVEKLGLCQ